MNRIELLAPAGSMESLYAAVQNGANAVYLGGDKFSARAYASNFDEENMIKAVNYCHLYNVKIYVTVNTLIKEDEMKEAISYIRFLYEIGVDALIIQDTGVADIVTKNFKDFEIHASTQMTVHNGEGAVLLKKLGFQRIVLSRELSLKEIKHISKDLNIETEIFIHGALCVSYSGQCLMSSLIGGRSGNRGRCAQPCRLPYEIINKSNKKSKKGYILSPKDICTIDNIRELIESGTSSLKIEGRMKRPEYVAGVVSAYRKAIDKVYNEVSSHKNNFNVDIEKKKLLQLFNREGFSKAYLFGNVGSHMMAYKFPKNMGVEIGTASKDLSLKLKEDISLQDGIRVGNSGFTISKIYKNSKEVKEAYKGDTVKLNPKRYKSNNVLYKTSDVKLLHKLKESYNDIYERKNSLNLKVLFKIGDFLTLETEFLGKVFKVQGEIVQKPLRRPLNKENLIKNLKKTGDRAFEFSAIEFLKFEEGFIPVSVINSTRRKLIDNIEEYIKNKDKRQYNAKIDFNILDKKNPKVDIQSPLVIVSNKEQLRAAKECDIQNIALKLCSREFKFDLKGINCENIFIKTSSIVKDEFHNVCKEIEKNLPYIKGIVTSNLGIINRFKDKTMIIGDYKINNFNSYSLEFYKNYLDMACISVELNKREIIKLLKNSPLKNMFIVYGTTELMVSEYCPIGSVFGGKSKKSACIRPCENGEFVLKDRKNEEFLIKTDKYCRSHIYNSVPTNLIPNLEEIKKMNIDVFRLDFVNEDYKETLRIIKDFKNESLKRESQGFTRGHFKRGVE